MELKEVQKYLKDNAGTDEVKKYLKGFITPEGVAEFISSDAGKKIVQPLLDSNFTKGLETWKTNNLKKLTDAEVEKAITERYPEETDAEKRLKKLESDLLSETSKRLKAEMTANAIKDATDKKLPTSLVKYFIGKDPEATKAALLDLETEWTGTLSKEVEKVFKDNGRDINNNNGGKAPEGLLTQAQVAKMSPAEVSKNMAQIDKSMPHW